GEGGGGEAKPSSAKGKGEHILLADDERLVREATSEVLESIGYKVLQAKDGLEAVEVFNMRQQDIALAVLDVVMPHGSGVQVAEELRELNPDVPVIFITGYDKEQVLGERVPMQNSEILSKPVRLDVLTDCIRRSLDRVVETHEMKRPVG
ncbi:MAG: response regulator, partial [Mariprofundaceae bacterium]|nr:response regulator [Mariprofundaceae bacterium]